jgi:hypothetical protein
VSDGLPLLPGRRVGQLRVDNELTVGFLAPGRGEDPEYVWLSIGGSFVYSPRDGPEHRLGEEDGPAQYAPALALLHKIVAAATCSASGELTVRFADGAALVIPTDPHYEAWRIDGEGLTTLVSPPGGGPPVHPVTEFRNPGSDPERRV